MDATKMLEYDADGCSLTFSIYDNLTIMSKVRDVGKSTPRRARRLRVEWYDYGSRMCPTNYSCAIALSTIISCWLHSMLVFPCSPLPPPSRVTGSPPCPVCGQSEYEALVPPPPPPEPVASPEPGQQTARLGTPRPSARSASGEAVAARQPSQSGEERRHRPLPEAAFAEDDDYQLDDAPPMPTNYIRYVAAGGAPMHCCWRRWL